MKDQAEPIAEDEWVLRRVHENWFVPLGSPAINPYAFKPQIGGDLPDVGGISHPSPALPGKLAGLTYRPSRECVVNQIIVTLRGRVR
jgi:hypothetical protein